VKVEVNSNDEMINKSGSGRHPNPNPMKQCRMRLNLDQKVKLIEESMQPGFCQAKAAREYGISTSSVSTILKKKFDIYCHPASNKTKYSRKNLTWGKNDVLESKLYEWYLQQTPLGNPVSGPILIAKAQELSQSYDCYATTGFKFSNGWLDGFKKRYDIAFSNKMYKKRKKEKDEQLDPL
jgi:predicted XRE-type DNA-binding protein